MLDWLFAVLILLALFMLVLAIYLRGEDAYWNILFITISSALWFIIAVSVPGGLETAYSGVNATSGNPQMYYDTYGTEAFVYLSYFFGMMGVLCAVYLVITLFGYYYEKIDEKNAEKEQDMME